MTKGWLNAAKTNIFLQPTLNSRDRKMTKLKGNMKYKLVYGADQSFPQYLLPSPIMTQSVVQASPTMGLVMLGKPGAGDMIPSSPVMAKSLNPPHLSHCYIQKALLCTNSATMQHINAGKDQLLTVMLL